MSMSQWIYGEWVWARLDGVSDAVLCYISAIDERTQRLRVTLADGKQTWVFMEWVYKP